MSFLRHFLDEPFYENILIPSVYLDRLRQENSSCKQKDISETEVDEFVVNDKHKFQVLVDVQHFKPNEIAVKIVDNEIVVEARHEEKQDQHGSIYRHFVRKFVIPEDIVIEEMQTKLNRNGILVIIAPKKLKQIANERIIPIQRIKSNK